MRKRATAAATDPRAEVRARMADEQGVLRTEAPDRVALVYPSPYRVGMSSLGFQTIYREIHGMPGRSAERAFLPDDPELYRRTRTPLFTYESERPVGDFPVVALSVAFELELAGVVQALELAGIPPLAEDRDEQHPFILGGGPLTFSNPLPLAPYVDAMLLGEADQTIGPALDVIFGAGSNAEAMAVLAAEVPSAFVPSEHDGLELRQMGRCDDDRLPAHSQIVTPHTELSNMFLVEAERGCSRRCKYCVMRRSTNGGMRKVPELIPDHARRVGLVGAAVSDHPRIVDLVNTLADQGRGVGLSSLRPDRLNDRFCAALKRGGYRTLTSASDGASQRLRDLLDRRAKENHLMRVAELARAHRFDRLKLYMMVGVPDETDEDIDALVRFGREVSRLVPLSLGIAPFVSKRNTPLDGLPFAGIKVVEGRLDRLRRGVRGRVDVRATSARWAWAEWVLAQGGRAEGRAVLDAVRAGGRFKDWKEAFAALPDGRPRRPLAVVA